MNTSLNSITAVTPADGKNIVVITLYACDVETCAECIVLSGGVERQ